MKTKTIKTVPTFTTEQEERLFWQTHDSTEYVDYSKAIRAQFPNLKLTSRPITLRLPVSLIDRVKIHAHKMDVPYQTLLKRFIADAVAIL